MLLMMACGGSGSQNSDGTIVGSPELRETILGDFNEDGTMEEVVLMESIEGDFNGDGKSEYAAIYHYLDEPDEMVENEDYDYYEYGHYYYIVFGDPAIPTIDVEWSAAHLVNEGDLNDDGSDELGFFNWGGYSLWGEYFVMTLEGGIWQEVVCVSHNEDWNPVPYEDIVSSHPEDEGCIIYTEIMVEDGGLQERVKRIVK